jgi:hypothetical protein
MTSLVKDEVLILIAVADLSVAFKYALHLEEQQGEGEMINLMKEAALDPVLMYIAAAHYALAIVVAF